jgi:hypothetical protein
MAFSGAIAPSAVPIIAILDTDNGAINPVHLCITLHPHIEKMCLFIK